PSSRGSVFLICAPRGLPLPAWVSDGHSTVEPLLSFHAPPEALSRYLVKLSVVPEPSERCATTMSASGSLASGLSAAMSLSFHFLMSRWKIFATVAGDSCSLSTPSRLNDTVIAPSRIGKYRTSPPLFFARSASLYGEAGARATTPPC